MESNLLTNGSIQPHVARFLWSELTSREFFIFISRKKSHEGKKKARHVCVSQATRADLSLRDDISLLHLSVARAFFFILPLKRRKKENKRNKIFTFLCVFRVLPAPCVVCVLGSAVRRFPVACQSPPAASFKGSNRIFQEFSFFYLKKKFGLTDKGCARFFSR